MHAHCQPDTHLGSRAACHDERAVGPLSEHHDITHNHVELAVQLACALEEVHAALVVDPEPVCLSNRFDDM